MESPTYAPAPVWMATIAGFVSGLLGALGFAAAHALLIVPIWGRMGAGLLFGALAGSVAGWALTELEPAPANESVGATAARGARFGARLWCLVAPVTVADALLRLAGIAPRRELLAVAVALTLAVGAGAAYGWRRSHRRRGALAGAAATLLLTVAMAGPVPISRSSRALGIFLAVLPLAALAGGILVLIARAFTGMVARRQSAATLTVPPRPHPAPSNER